MLTIKSASRAISLEKVSRFLVWALFLSLIYTLSFSSTVLPRAEASTTVLDAASSSCTYQYSYSSNGYYGHLVKAGTSTAITSIEMRMGNTSNYSNTFIEIWSNSGTSSSPAIGSLLGRLSPTSSSPISDGGAYLGTYEGSVSVQADQLIWVIPKFSGGTWGYWCYWYPTDSQLSLSNSWRYAPTSMTNYRFYSTATSAGNTSDFVIQLRIKVGAASISLSSPTNLTASATSNTLKSFSTSWTNSSNAASHTVKIYASNGTTLLQTIENATSPLTVTASNFASIADGTTYKVSVMAEGTGSYTDSAEASQVSVTTNNAALTPTFGSPSFSSGTWTIPVTNYDANYTWAFSVSGGSYTAASASGSTRNITVTPTSGNAVTLTASTSRTGYLNGSATTSSYYGGCNPTQTQSGDYEVFRFTSTSTCNWVFTSNPATVDVLVVGGGGGGGADGGGGGGGGEMRYENSNSLTAGTIITVTAGEGGIGGRWNVRGSSSGTSSTLSWSGKSYEARGGSGAGGWSPSDTSGAGGTGGSGGSGSNGASGGRNPAQTAGSVGGDGVAGPASSITGSSTNYGGGGGGGICPTFSTGNLSGGQGGPGGGGAGATHTYSAKSTNGYSGTANTGGGGGGGSACDNGGTNNNNQRTDGGSGGSGVVIIRYFSDVTAPDAPTSLSVASASDSGSTSSDAITTDTTPTITGSAEANSTVQLYVNGTSSGSTCTATSGTFSCTTGTLSGGTYSITAKATDAAGNVSNASTGLSVVIDLTNPTLSSSTPSDNGTGVAGDANIVITMAESVYAGSGNIVIYKSSDDSVFESIPIGNSKVTISSGVVTVNPAGVFTADSGYYVLIDSTAIRDLAGNYYSGISSSSALNFTTYQPATPSYVNPSSASRTSGQSITWSVSPTVSDSGALTYQWLKDDVAISGATSNSYTISSISSASAGTYKVVITNTKNSVSASFTSTGAVLTLVGAPASPQSVTFSNKNASNVDLSAGSLRLYWSAPSTDGGSAVTGYEYRYSLSDQDSWSTWLETSDTTVTIDGLSNGKSYKAQVRAKNTYGVSASAQTSASVSTNGTLATTTGAPTITSITVDTSLGGRLTVNFTEPTVTEVQNAITSYQYSTDNGSSWKTATWTAGTTSFVMTTPSNSTGALTNGVIYTVLLRAVNAAGPGTASAGATGTPSKAPGAPSALSIALPGSNVSGTIVATFTASSDTGGLTVTYQYRIKLSSSSTWGDWTNGGSASPFNITGITNGQTYDVQVRATNNSGSSDASNTATLNTILASGPTITTQPTNKNLTVDQTTGTTLTVAATGGAGETLSYQWYKNGSAITGATSATLTVTNKAASGDAGTYYAVVTASKSGSSGNVTAKIDAMGPSNSICNAPNNSTFYYGNRFYAGTADTIKEFQIQVQAGANAAVLAAMKIRFYSSDSAGPSGKMYNTWTTASNHPIDRRIGDDFTYVSISNNIATFRGTAQLPAAGHYWWGVVNTSTTSISFCNSNAATTESNGWYLYKEGSSWIWFGSFRQNSSNGKFAWYTHPNIRIYTTTTTTVSTSTTQSNSVTVTVNDKPTITTSTIPGATRGSSYSTTLENSGGTGPFTWALVNGSSLPSGLSLSSTGVISGTPTATQASSSSNSSSSTSGALKNGDFSATFASSATTGWFRAATRGGQTVINTTGKTMQFSYGSPACTSQSTVPMSEVQQRVTIPTAGAVTFKVTVINNIWNRIGAGYSNPCYDPYQVRLSRSGGSDVADTGRRVPTSTTHPWAVEHEVSLTLTTTTANEVVTISLFGLDAGYWAGNYGPVFKNASLETPGGSSGGSGGSGETTFTVEITDANGIKSTKVLSFAVASDIAITTKTVGSASIGASYTQALTATGGSAPLVWTVSSGSLPTGLTLNPSGSISGTVDAAASSTSFTLAVTDINNAVVTQSYTLSVLSGVPGAPTSLTLGTIGSGTVPLTWTAPTDNGGSPVTGYVVSYSSAKGKSDDGEDGEEDKGSVLVNATGLTFPYSLSGLKNGRTYSITVSAKNANATSVASNEVSAVPAKAASEPQQLSTVLANGGITVRWKKPQDTGGLRVASYTVQCRNTATADTDANWKTITNRQDTDSNNQISMILDTTSTELTVTAGQSYVCRIRSVSTINNVTYTGAWATSSPAITFNTVPSAPAITSFDTATVSTKVTVNFNQSSDDGGSQITSYIATIKRNKSSSEDADNDKEDNRSCNVNRGNGFANGTLNCEITGVPKKGSFTLEVVAVNAVGRSVVDTRTVTILGSTQVLTYPDGTNNPGYLYSKVVTDADFPIGVTSNSGLQLKYSIDNNDICTITGKGLIKIKKIGTCRITITQSGKADDGDDDDSNNKTESDWEPITGTSQYVDINITGSKPSNPSWTSVTPGDTKLTALWKAPTGKNNQVTDYRVEWTTDLSAVTWSSSDSKTVTGTLLTTEITGLTNGTSYRVRVTALNSGNASSAVLMPGSFKPAGVPSKPSISTILEFPDTSTVTVSWTAPADNGSAVTGYTVTATEGQNTLSCSTGGSATSCSITGIKNKVTYSISMRARNSIGSSVVSDASSVTVAGVSQTISLTTTPAGTGWSVGDPDLQLNATTSSGLPLQFGVQSSSICTVSSGGLVHFVSDGTCQVYINQDGTNSSTGSGAATKYSAASQYGPIELVIAPAKPSAPVLTSVTNSSGGLVIAWNAPSKGGGTMTYTVTGTASSKSNETCQTQSLTCTIQVGSKGTRYSFTAVAYNGIDTSTASVAMFGTWLVVPSAPTTSSTPSIASTTDGKAINVYWNKSDENGGITIISYTATATNATYGSKSCVVTRTSTRDETGYSCVISGLRAGAPYTVSVTSINAIGTSPALAFGSAITPGLTQNISLGANTTSSMSKTFGDADFQLNATLDSGNTPSFTTSSAACTVTSSGLVHIVAVGTCTVTIAHSGASNAVDSQYLSTSTTITIEIGYGTPSKATITQVSPANNSLIVKWNAPSTTGGSVLTYVARATLGGSNFDCSAGSNESCTITGLTNGSEYQVRIIATNSGTNPATNNSTSDAVTGIPYYNALAPMPLTASGGVRSSVMTWQQPAQFSGNIYQYKLYYRVASSSGAYTEVVISDTSTVSTTITGLADDTRYEFLARAIVIDSSNVTAEGEQTSAVFATTLAVPGAPQSISATSTYNSGSNTSSINVGWQPPANNGGSAITGYTVTATSGASTETCTTTTGLTCTVNNLNPGGDYTITVVATSAVGSGGSASASHTTVAPAAAPTSVLTTLNSDSGTVMVDWTAPSSDGGTPITSYVVTVYTDAGAATAFGCTVSAPSTSCAITGLPYKTAYKVAVAAVTAAGTGTSSAFSSNFTLSLDQTITFNEISAQNFDAGSFTLDAVSSSGLAITYTSSDTTVCTVSGSLLTFVKIGNCTITAAQSGSTTYNAATSVTQSFLIQAVDPAAVTLLQVSPGASKLTLTWTQATQLGGSTLKHYVVSWAKQTDFSDEQTLTTSDYSDVVIPDLDPNTAYIVRVAVVTNDGTNPSDWSNRLSAKTFGSPTAPSAPTVTTSAAGLVTVSWTNVSTSSDEAQITGYRVDAFEHPSGTATSFFCTAAASTCDISGLSGSSYYTFKVTAINAVGSTASEASEAVRPGQSQTINFADVSTTHLAGTISLAATTTSGLPLSYSVVSQNPTNAETDTWGSGRNVCVVDSAGNLTVDIGGSCVIAVNQDGTDDGTGTSYLPATEETATITVAIDAPSLIAELTLTAGNEMIDVSWDAPTDDGGAPITHYIVTWYVKGSRDASLTTNGTTPVTSSNGSYGRVVLLASELTSLNREINNLVNGTTYTIHVQAKNSTGVGPES